MPDNLSTSEFTQRGREPPSLCSTGGWNHKRMRMFEAPAWTFASAATAPSYALGGALLKFYADEHCTSPIVNTYAVQSGICMGGIAVTACNAAQGWAQTLWWNSNACDAAPNFAATLSTTECTHVANWGADMYIKLGRADCSAPATPALEIIQFSDASCTYGDWPTSFQPVMTVPWTAINPVSPSSCSQGYWSNGVSAPWNNTKIVVHPSGAVDIFNYASDDATCTGPVYSSFVGLSYAAGNSHTSGTCTPATTGAALFAHAPVGQAFGWVRIAQSPAFTHGATNYKCAAAAPATGAAPTAAAVDTTTGPAVAGAVVGVVALGAAAAAVYCRFFAPASGVKAVLHGNPAASRV